MNTNHKNKSYLILYFHHNLKSICQLFQSLSLNCSSSTLTSSVSANTSILSTSSLNRTLDFFLSELIESVGDGASRISSNASCCLDPTIGLSEKESFHQQSIFVSVCCYFTSNCYTTNLNSQNIRILNSICFDRQNR